LKQLLSKAEKENKALLSTLQEQRLLLEDAQKELGMRSESVNIDNS